ncbi:hypothetical protein INT45_010206 [Circinella minor]|uniref:Uncharacterized protein n=1 Tax=Circinella minor TaxID=1195481 RepID=A0A8H7VPV0_9FUNG|nr:hypothetical protein INT45_010206 [Circinella minor]
MKRKGNKKQTPVKDINQLAKTLKARLQYARFKVQNGMTNQSLEQMENQVERQLSYLEPIHYDNNDIFSMNSMNTNYRISSSSSMTCSTNNDGFPPTPPQTQQRRGRPSRKSEREEEERAARNLMMISSSPRCVPKLLKRPLPPHMDNNTTNNIQSPTLPSFQDIVSRVPDYDQQSRQFAESFRYTSSSPGLPMDSSSLGGIETRFPYFPPVNWTGALSPVENSYPINNNNTRTPTSPGYRYHVAAKNSQLH